MGSMRDAPPGAPDDGDELSSPRRDRHDGDGDGSNRSDAGSGADDGRPGKAPTNEESTPGRRCDVDSMECSADGGQAPCASGDACTAPRACEDHCPKPDGVDWACKLRFMYGINYAWHHFGGDFGGNAAWMQPGVSQNPAVARELEELANHGVSVLRWWVFPDFRGDGVSFDTEERPLGLGGSALADLEHALALAEAHDLYLMLTLFSFDNFRPTREEDGVRARGIRSLVLDATKRKALLERVVRPFAKAAAASAHADRLIAWDVMNEPEWAITGDSLHGDDPAFDPNPELETITHAQMESFLADTIEVLRSESEALITVGATAMKWRSAWSQLDLDFYQFHIYDWVNMFWPYDGSPAEYGVDDRPVVMGEFPTAGLSNVGYEALTTSWFENGYAGALSWSYTDHQGGFAEVRSFAERHACETTY